MAAKKAVNKKPTNQKAYYQKLLQLQKLKAQRDFFTYCNVMAPDFYKSERAFLVDLCKQLQEFYESDDEVFIINAPPRHGKTRTVGEFIQWILGRNQNEKIMTGSYNETLSTTLAKNVRNTIMEEKADENKLVYSDIFPAAKIKRGDGAMNLWSLENGYNNYLATSPTGTATGFGASLLIIDDLIKNAEEANNAAVLEKHWEWFTNTMLSRLEEGGKIIIVMTRWHTQDLAGRALNHFTAAGAKLRHISYKAMDDNGNMLCDEILSRKSYENKRKAMGLDIAEANYQQNPIDIRGRLYNSFKTYDGELPEFKKIKNYTDTADTGNDYLCSIVYGVTFSDEAYILDVLYTQDSMEKTEPAEAKQLHDFKVNIADIESNNGGRGYARSVDRILKTQYGSNRTRINPFTQSKNKISRILTNSTWVMDHIYFPADWRNRWPEFYDAMSTYQRQGKNAHDDAPDAVTGVAEKIDSDDAFSFD
jgi:predicted phage terminase large subunit-like protein